MERFNVAHNKILYDCEKTLDRYTETQKGIIKTYYHTFFLNMVKEGYGKERAYEESDLTYFGIMACEHFRFQLDVYVVDIIYYSFLLYILTVTNTKEGLLEGLERIPIELRGNIRNILETYQLI